MTRPSGGWVSRHRRDAVSAITLWLTETSAGPCTMTPNSPWETVAGTGPRTLLSFSRRSSHGLTKYSGCPTLHLQQPSLDRFFNTLRRSRTRTTSNQHGVRSSSLVPCPGWLLPHSAFNQGWTATAIASDAWKPVSVLATEM